jgi:hypothetical protein
LIRANVSSALLRPTERLLPTGRSTPTTQMDE